MSDTVKSCTNCTRAPQALSEFVGNNGRICSTCHKCREKGKKNDSKPERKEYTGIKKNEMREAGYWVDYSKKKRNGEIEKKEHDMDQTCKWSRNEKALERLSQWKKLNIHDRIGNYKRTAAKKGFEWKLNDEQAEIMMTHECIYCKYIDLSKRLNGIDRLNQKGDYTVENTVPCCWTCNYMKGVMDPLTFIEKCMIISKCNHQFPLDIPRQELDLYLKRKKTLTSLTQPIPATTLETHTIENLNPVELHRMEMQGEYPNL
jgi:hypothetical protein